MGYNDEEKGVIASVSEAIGSFLFLCGLLLTLAMTVARSLVLSFILFGISPSRKMCGYERIHLLNSLNNDQNYR